MSSNNFSIPILSFYSGGGFLDMGFEISGYNVVWTNEFDETFAKLHSAGITSWRKSMGREQKAEIFNTQSITDISSKQIITEAFPDGKPDYFGVIGGPPCQDFSLNGSKKGFKGKRGKLTVEYFDKILEIKPTFFVMENVTGLVRQKAYSLYLNKLLKRIKRDYYIDSKILNSIDFGVPQSRQRVFFIGIRKSTVSRQKSKYFEKESWFSWPNIEKYKDSLKKHNWPSTNEFGKSLRKPKNLPKELCVENCLVPKRQMKSLPNASEYFPLYVNEKKLLSIKEGETNRPSFKRLHRFRYSPTACYGNNEVHLHPYVNRRISVREALRIQGVPDSYVLPKDVNLSKKFKMIGNGVPVPLANAIADSLKEFLVQEILS